MALPWQQAFTPILSSCIEDHPRFRDVKLGIIVSSVRALQIFCSRTAKLNRLPDYVVVEGPLAGGHLGFGLDWPSMI